MSKTLTVAAVQACPVRSFVRVVGLRVVLCSAVCYQLNFVTNFVVKVQPSCLPLRFVSLSLFGDWPRPPASSTSPAATPRTAGVQTSGRTLGNVL